MRFVILTAGADDGRPETHMDAGQVIHGIATIDIKYQTEERPDRAPGKDPHQGIMRDYILNDGLQGSGHLLAIRNVLRAEILAGAPNDQRHPPISSTLQDLCLRFEATHPNESFYPTND
ncbi:MAG TPA: hypothetical protein VMS08_02610 [Candidatus Saccharimonadia bacterium]|nr:hypothetical protein [Candidatus Saccharimonadia bacterium]